MVAATLRTIFAHPDREGARETIARISGLFERRLPKLVAVLQEATPCRTIPGFSRAGYYHPW
jgi:transposase-like protein